MLYQIVLSALALSASAFTTVSSTVDAYVSTEGPLAKDGMLASTGPDGNKS